MDEFFDQLERAALSGLYYVALLAALAVPDICGAMDADDGRASGARYQAWFDAYASGAFTYGDRVFLSGVDCYYFRCSFLHQGSSQNPSSSYGRILFVEPGAASGSVLHLNVLHDALNIDVSVFCRDMAGAGRRWLEGVRGTERFERNSDAFLRRYPQGLPPYISGVPVYG